jgi:hypothetical protein
MQAARPKPLVWIGSSQDVDLIKQRLKQALEIHRQEHGK